MPAGRPTKYKPEYCETIIELAKLGKFEAAWACACDVNKSTFVDWKVAFPEFAIAFARARQECEAFWDEETAKSAMSNTGSAPLLKFLQAAVFGKKETTGIEHSGEITNKQMQVDFASRPADN